jgi:two-component system NtrC family response regulator
MADILIIDDDPVTSETLTDMVKRSGHEAFSAYSISDGIAYIHSRPFDVVFLDVQLPDGNGLDALPEIQAAPSRPEVVIITGFGNPDGAELAIKNGAWDYIEKPISLKTVVLAMQRVLQYREAKKGTIKPRVLNRTSIIGSSDRMSWCMDLVAQAAASSINVLVTGETGTGKELIARAIHSNGARAASNFTTVDCASIPPTIMASVLFGHEKGAFTSADRPREGLLKQADGGTLFLDEVGELPIEIQKAFLRVLQERTFRPLGSSHEVKSDFRLIAATNRNLDQMVELKQFRHDLLYRLKAFTIELPSLRERKGDIKELTIHYNAKICDHYGIDTKGFSPEFIEALMAYEWPGNIREVINTLERVVAVARNEPTLYPIHLPVEIRVNLARSSLNAFGNSQRQDTVSGNDESNIQTFRAHKKIAERAYLLNLMKQANQSIKEACKNSNLSRSRLHALLKIHNISKFN